MNAPEYIAMSSRPASKASQHVVALDYEIAQEQASALGRLGRALEAALAALAEYDRLHRDDRGRLSRRNSVRGWYKMPAMRCGASWSSAKRADYATPGPVIRDYRVPAEVQNRMGIFTGRRRATSA